MKILKCIVVLYGLGKLMCLTADFRVCILKTLKKTPHKIQVLNIAKPNLPFSNLNSESHNISITIIYIHNIFEKCIF